MEPPFTTAASLVPSLLLVMDCQSTLSRMPVVPAFSHVTSPGAAITPCSGAITPNARATTANAILLVRLTVPLLLVLLLDHLIALIHLLSC